MVDLRGKPVYQALALPSEALANGGIEVLRAGIIDDELYVTARRAFKDPAQWGEVLADITRRIGLLYAAETDLTEKEIIAAIESAFAAKLGAPPATRPAVRKSVKRIARRKAAARRGGKGRRQG